MVCTCRRLSPGQPVAPAVDGEPVLEGGREEPRFGGTRGEIAGCERADETELDGVGGERRFCHGPTPVMAIVPRAIRSGVSGGWSSRSLLVRLLGYPGCFTRDERPVLIG